MTSSGLPFSRYRLSLAYDGSCYCGWQRQQNGLSIQETVERALTTLFRAPIRLIGSGRTDSGVHALEQMAHFDLCLKTATRPLLLERILYSANCILPPDIRLLSLEPASLSFHACYSAKRKTYRYYFSTGPVSSPFTSPFRYHLFHSCEISQIQEALSYFMGTHDFTTFSNESDRGAAGRDPIRTIYAITLLKRESPYESFFTPFGPEDEEEIYCIEFEGNGFLYKMVRNIMGTLIEIGKGKIKPSAVEGLLRARQRSLAPPPAPAHGLFLIKVVYNS